MRFDESKSEIVGDGGVLPVLESDDVARRFLMLVEGECSDLGPLNAARKFGFSKQRYFQLRAAFLAEGTTGLITQKRGPKSNYRRTNEAVRQIIRHRFLDPDASAHVIAQKLNQVGMAISIRSVERVIAEFGLQKKTPPLPSKF